LKIKRVHLRFLLFSIVVSITAFQISAQPICGNFSNPNSINYIKIIDIKTESQQWENGRDSGVSVKVMYRSENDSVVIYQNGVMSGHFLTNYYSIVSPCLVLRNENGNLQSIDSFRLTEAVTKEVYYGSFTANVFVHREYYSTGIPSKACYKDISCRDSLLIEWSPDGIIRRRKVGDTEYLYTADGILSMKSSWKDTVQYANGIITSVVKDTMILNQWVKHVRKYSTKGTLLKESWFKDYKPVATWREYNAEGVLVKTTKHPALVKAPLSVEVADMEAPEALMFVAEDAEYAGGRTQFFKYMNEGLPHVFSSGDFPLQGIYTIRFEIMEDGKPVYLSAHGENAASIQQSLKDVIEHMPRWRSGRRSGFSVREVIVLTISVSKK
jgi:antitoxin component YwqK of YwqJK toxin-antitoxin module